ERLVLRHDGTGLFLVTYSSDGKMVLTAGKDGTARLWDSRTGQPLAVFRHGRKLTYAALSPDGQRVVTADEESPAKLCNTASHGLVALLKHRQAVKRASFCADGQRVVTSSEGSAQLWDAETGEALGKLLGPFPDLIGGPNQTDALLAQLDISGSAIS